VLNLFGLLESKNSTSKIIFLSHKDANLVEMQEKLLEMATETELIDSIETNHFWKLYKQMKLAAKTTSFFIKKG
jgi:UDP-N-acetylglucosamine 2-epimerase